MTTRRRRGTDRNERTRVRRTSKKRGTVSCGEEVPSVTPLLIVFQFFLDRVPGVAVATAVCRDDAVD